MMGPSNYSFPNVPTDLNQPNSNIDGTRLTITVTYDDGTCETQVIDLHQIDVVANRDGTPVTPLRLFDEKAFLRGEYADGESMVTITYGTLVSKSSDPFPYADEPANQYADEVMPPMPLWPQGN